MTVSRISSVRKSHVTIVQDSPTHRHSSVRINPKAYLDSKRDSNSSFFGKKIRFIPHFRSLCGLVTHQPKRLLKSLKDCLRPLRKSRNLFHSSKICSSLSEQTDQALVIDSLSSFVTRMRVYSKICDDLCSISLSYPTVFGPDGFFAQCQKQQLDKATVDRLIDNYHIGKEISHVQLLRMLVYETQELSAVQDNAHDMSRPFRDYWINSSHNTYLAGRQFGFGAKIRPLIDVLKEGCRCIEIDIWEYKNRLVVSHGFLTNRLDFRQVLRAIKTHAFTTSKYPLIISLDVNIRQELEREMLNAIEEVLDDYLLKSATDDLLETPIENLCYKILLKRKRYLITTTDDQSQNDSAPCAFVTSVRESRAVSMIESSERRLVTRTQDELFRVFPCRSQVNSNNLHPMRLWLSGFQMVALNHQRAGKQMVLNQTLFKMNGQSGYYLKPDVVRGLCDIGKPAEKFSIKLICGYCSVLPVGFSKTDFSNCVLKVKLHGYETDTYKMDNDQRFKSEDKLFNLDFETEPVEIESPETTIIEITLKTHSRVGTFSAVVSSLRCGYRLLNLTDALGRIPNQPNVIIAYIERTPIEQRTKK